MKTRLIDAAFILLLAISILLANSCTVSRKVQKNKETVTETARESAVVTATEKDKTVTTITEERRDTIMVPGQKLEAESAGTATLVVVSGDTLAATYDAGKNVITATYTGAPKRIPVNVAKKTEIHSDIVKEKVTRSDSSGEKKTEKEIKQVEQTTSCLWIRIVAGVIILLAVGGYYLYRLLKKRGIL